MLDVRIAGKGSGTLEADVNEQGKLVGSRELKLKVTRLVLERDYVGNDQEEHTQRLVFEDPEDSFLHGSPPAITIIQTDLTAFSSTDPACPKNVDGAPRRAVLLINDRGTGPKAGKSDSISLRVRRCAHHEYSFKGVNRVKVAISVK